MKRFLLASLLAISGALAQGVPSGEESSDNSSLVRICDARPPAEGSPRLAVFLNELRATPKSRPGNNTTWGKMPPGKYVLSAKDSKSNEVLLPATNVILEPGSYLNLVILQKEGKLEAVSISVKGKETRDLLKKTAGLALFIPINLSSDTIYTVRYPNAEGQVASEILNPGDWKQFATQSAGKWVFAGQPAQSQAAEIPAGAFPPSALMAGRVALIMLPDPKLPDSKLRVLDGMGGGFISEDK